jgi:long-chain acyl-CoA synthetase
MAGPERRVTLISGGAALPRDTEEFWRRLGYAVVQGYGLTETTSLISAAHPFKLSRGSIGKVLPGREMKLDPETGEILVRGESVTSGYWQEGKKKPVPGEEGWLRTGDIGALDAEGNLYFKRRKKEVIGTPEGFNVYPEDLEGALRRQPEVQRRGGDRAGTPRQRRALCGASYARYGRPRRCGAPRQQIAGGVSADTPRFVWPDEDFPRTSTRLHRDANLATDLNLSSIERVELMSALEDRYQIDLNEARFSEAGTIGDVERMVRAARDGMAGEAASAPPDRSAGLPLQKKRDEADDEQARTPTPPAPIARFHYPRWAQHWPVTWIRVAVYYLLSWPATVLLAMPRVVGRDKLRGVGGPVLVISNHITYLDAGLVLYALPVRLRHRLAVAMAAEMLQEIATHHWR